MEEGRKSSAGNRSEYFLYHEPSNLVVVTVENETERETIVSQDYSKINFGSLILLNSKDTEENYSNKIGYEVEEYKHSANEDRRWRVTLGPHETFTWVISTDLPFNENNVKAWGFR